MDELRVVLRVESRVCVGTLALIDETLIQHDLIGFLLGGSKAECVVSLTLCKYRYISDLKVGSKAECVVPLTLIFTKLVSCKWFRGSKAECVLVLSPSLVHRYAMRFSICRGVASRVCRASHPVQVSLYLRFDSWVASRVCHSSHPNLL
jgi:hypothetical protein